MSPCFPKSPYHVIHDEATADRLLRESDLNIYVWRWIDEDGWWQAQQQRFGEVSDELLGMALNYFQDQDFAIQWFTHPYVALGNEIPLKLCRTHEGIDRIRDVLHRLTSGMTI